MFNIDELDSSPDKKEVKFRKLKWATSRLGRTSKFTTKTDPNASDEKSKELEAAWRHGRDKIKKLAREDQDMSQDELENDEIDENAYSDQSRLEPKKDKSRASRLMNKDKDKEKKERSKDKKYADESYDEDGNLLETAASDTLTPKFSSKADTVGYFLKMANQTPQKDFVKWFDDMINQFGPGKELGIGDTSEKNKSTIVTRMGKGALSDHKDPMEKLNCKEDVESLFEGETLSDEFKANAATLFEAAVNARVQAELISFEEGMEEVFIDQLAEVLEQVDTYLNYAVNTWMDENRVAVESSLRSEITEEFIINLKSLFENHYIDIPEEKVNVVEELSYRVEELENSLHDQIEINRNLRSSAINAEKRNIFDTVTEGLSVSAKEKFRTLSETVAFTSSDKYEKSLELIKKKFIRETTSSDTSVLTESFEGEISHEKVSNDPEINEYAKAISRSIKK